MNQVYKQIDQYNHDRRKVYLKKVITCVIKNKFIKSDKYNISKYNYLRNVDVKGAYWIME